MSDPLNPTAKLLCKLGSIAVHAEEFTGKDSHHFDLEAIKSLLQDEEIVTWLKQMEAMALIPERRRHDG